MQDIASQTNMLALNAGIEAAARSAAAVAHGIRSAKNGAPPASSGGGRMR